ncbi:MAG: hypothetical protein QME85_07730 [Candidatus Saccharicenans sp.]|nr:hypothetical protein [Candidatus Saccharicenans sp.]MDI6850128.1 hypothetical protein [Candidatus Saccharicenans sp.]
MAKNPACIKVVLWIYIVLLALWFLLFSFAPSKLLEAIGSSETTGFYLRLYGVFPLGWVILLLFALKDPEKNLAILNSAVIVSILTGLSVILVHLGKPGFGLFQWVSIAIMFLFALLIYIYKPKVAKQ